MDTQTELVQIRQAGMEKAASIWETLEHLPNPITPADIFKAAVTAKCAEFSSRVRTHRLAAKLLKLVLKFMNESLAIVGVDAGTVPEGARVLTVLAEAMPLTDEVFNDPVSYAMRQHTYDGLLLLAAAKLGREVDTKKCIEGMQQGIKTLLIMSYLKGAGLSSDTVQ